MRASWLSEDRTMTRWKLPHFPYRLVLISSFFAARQLPSTCWRKFTLKSDLFCGIFFDSIQLSEIQKPVSGLSGVQSTLKTKEQCQSLGSHLKAVCVLT
jgi:hypothetical protein